MIVTLLHIVHVIVCFVLIMVVLLQSGKAADLAGAFGGMGSQTAFGPRGSATVLSKATTVCAILFMITSLALSLVGSKGKGPASVLGTGGPRPVQQQQNKPAPRPVPATPAPPK